MLVMTKNEEISVPHSLFFTSKLSDYASLIVELTVLNQFLHSIDTHRVTTV